MTELDTAKRRIEAAARKREEAIAAREEASRELARYCRDGRSYGVSVAEMASWAGLSRQALYELLGKRDEP